MAASSPMEESMVADLEKLAAALPSPQPPSPSPSTNLQQGLSFSVAGVGLERWEQQDHQSLPMMPSELMDSTLSLDFGGLGGSSSSESSLVAAGAPAEASGSSQNVENGEERGRLLVHYAGGSITFLLQIAVVAWSVRQLRRVLARRRQMMRDGQVVSEARINSLPFRPVDFPPFAMLSSLAVRKLVELDSVPFLLIDVRHPEAVRANQFSLEYVINIPESEVRACLQLVEDVWGSRFPAAKQPSRTAILVFVSTRGQRAQRAAMVAAELGFNGCCVLAGGIQSFVSVAGSSYVNLLGRFACFLIALHFQDMFFAQNMNFVKDNQRASFSEIATCLWLSIRLQTMASFLVFFGSMVAVLSRDKGLLVNATTAGLIGLALSYVAAIISPLNNLLSAFAETEKELVSVERVQQYWSTSKLQTRVLNSMMTTFRKTGQNEKLFYRPELPPTLNEISFHIAPGERVKNSRSLVVNPP